jgi:DHA1 family bicyclomycin/chloramphenicol resistance-like MFS transporter
MAPTHNGSPKPPARSTSRKPGSPVLDPTTQQMTQARRAPGRLLALLMAMTAIGPLSLNILVPALPGLARRTGTDPEFAQLAVSLYLFGLAVSQLVLGPLSDRFGRRPVVLYGLALTVMSSIGGIAADTMGHIIFARILQSLCASVGLVIGRAIIRDLYDRERAASMIGWVATAMVVAPMVAPLIGGVLDTSFGWQSTFVFVAVVSAVILAWTFTTLPETKPDHVTSGGLRHLAGDAVALFRDAGFNGYVLVAALGSATFFAFLGGGPHVVIAMMGRTSAEYGVWFALTAFSYLLGNMTTARMTPRYGLDPMIRAGVVFELVGVMLSFLAAMTMPAGGPEIVFLPQTFISFGNGLLLPNAIAGAISVRPQAAGTASGISGFAQFAIGGACAQFMSHVLVTASTPMPLALAMMVLAGLAAASFAWLVPHTRRR